MVWKGGCNVTSAMKKEEVKIIRGLDWVQVTVKAAVLEHEPECPNIVVSYVYNIKAVHIDLNSNQKNHLCWDKKQVFPMS